MSFDEDWAFFRGNPFGAELPSFDDSDWRVLDVPHDWSIEDLPYAKSTAGGATSDPSLFDYATGPTVNGPTPEPVPSVIGPFDEKRSAGGAATGWTVGGYGWYRKHFTLTELGVPTSPSQRQYFELRLDGVYEVVDVWLNGQHVGFQPDGYVPILLDLTPYLSLTGENVLAVRVNNTGKNSRWYSGSGIYRHTWLTVTGPVRVPTFELFATTPSVSASSATVKVAATIANSGPAVAITPHVTVLDATGSQVASILLPTQNLTHGQTKRFATELTVTQPELWSPDTPTLYTAQVALYSGGQLVDSDSSSFGIRSIEWNGTNGFLLNGVQTKIRGANLHHSHGPMGAVALARSEQREVETLQAAGFNAIRTAHNPPSPAFLDACDAAGMLVWDEFSDVWDAAKNPQDYHLYFPVHWPGALSSMIKRDRNHPSVVIWSLGNEINDTTNGTRGAQMKSLVRELDTTRPVTQGAKPFDSITDPDYRYVDVVDVHYDLPSPDKNGLHAAYPKRAMTQSEAWPATIYEDYQFALENSWFVGSWTWVGWDYLGESGTGAPEFAAPGTPVPVFGNAGYPWFQDFQGDIDLIGQRKPQNYWRSVVYGLSDIEMMVERPAPAGTQQVANDWSYYDELPSWTWDVTNGQSMTVHVYTSGDSVTLSLNGQIIATTAVTASDECVATFNVPYSPGTLSATASLRGEPIGSRTLATVGTPAALQLSSDVQTVTTGRDDLAHLLAVVIDANGEPVPDAVVAVSFQTTGAGELVAVGNGNPHNLGSFQRPERFTWHGRALAIIRPSKTPGTITVTATAPGLAPATTVIPVGPVPTTDTRDSSSISRRRLPRPLVESIAGLSGGPLLVLGALGVVLRRRLNEQQFAADE